jgi:glutamyl-tRNA synthetase
MRAKSQGAVMTVRTRVAPSPTGAPHVGTAYIALFNLCFARQHGGSFVLRIEDTDQARSTAAQEEAILRALQWLGLDWDEGPGREGAYGPYRQSQRRALYERYAHQLVEQGDAFVCYRTPDELDELRAEHKAAGRQKALKAEDLELSADEQRRRADAGMPSVIRLRVPDSGPCEIQDRLRGTIQLHWEQVDAQVLLKSDGMPTYHLANVVDDHEMAITHVIRGEEWIDSAPKHRLLYEHLGWVMPELTHMPLLRNPDKSKLSKRKNPTGINYYREAGYLPEALVNYLGRMGWSMPDEREQFSLSDMLEHFDLERISLGGPVFDVEKLAWLNGQWLRGLGDEDFLQRLVEWKYNRERALAIIPHIRDRVETLGQVVDKAGFCFNEQPAIDASSFAHKHLDAEDMKVWLQYFLWSLEEVETWNRDVIFACAKSLAGALELKVRDFLFPVFVAIAGTASSFSVVDSMEFLGPDLARMRLRRAIDVLGGVSKKQNKKLEKEWRALQGAA